MTKYKITEEDLKRYFKKKGINQGKNGIVIEINDLNELHQLNYLVGHLTIPSLHYCIAWIRDRLYNTEIKVCYLEITFDRGDNMFDDTIGHSVININSKEICELVETNVLMSIADLKRFNYSPEYIVSLTKDLKKKLY